MTGYMSADDCRLSDLIDLVSQKTSLDEYPYAQAVEENGLIYDGARLRAALSRATERPRVEASPAAIANVIAACAEGYPFPTNLDLDQPAGSLAPPTQADILTQAVAEGWSQQQLKNELGAW